MKLRFIAGCMTFIAAFAMGCSASRQTMNKTKIKLSSGLWQAAPITIDGNDREWMLSPFYKDIKSGICFSVANDRNYLYLALKGKDPMLRTKLLRSGLTVFLSANDTKKRLAAITYPLPSNGPLPDGSLRHDTSIRKALTAMNIMERKGFKQGNGLFPVGQHDSSGFRTSLSFIQADGFFYEAQIPFKSFYNHFLINSDAGHHIYISLEIQGLSRSELMTTRPTGKLSLEHANNNEGNNENQKFLLETTKIWISIPLAFQ